MRQHARPRHVGTHVLRHTYVLRVVSALNVSRSVLTYILRPVHKHYGRDMVHTYKVPLRDVVGLKSRECRKLKRGGAQNTGVPPAHKSLREVRCSCTAADAVVPLLLDRFWVDAFEKFKGSTRGMSCCCCCCCCREAEIVSDVARGGS